MVLHQYDYLFAIGTIFAGLDAWNIGEQLPTKTPISSTQHQGRVISSTPDC
jgi:hypothetical protein